MFAQVFVEAFYLGTFDRSIWGLPTMHFLQMMYHCSCVLHWYMRVGTAPQRAVTLDRRPLRSGLDGVLGVPHMRLVRVVVWGRHLDEGGRFRNRALRILTSSPRESAFADQGAVYTLAGSSYLALYCFGVLWAKYFCVFLYFSCPIFLFFLHPRTRDSSSVASICS